MNNSKNKMKHIIQRCLDTLSISSEFSLDMHIPEDDFSAEHVLTEMLYNASVLERATGSKNRIGQLPKELDFIFSSAKNTISYLDIKKSKKLVRYHKRFFNYNNYNENLNALRTTMLEAAEKSENKIDPETYYDQVFHIIDKKDKADLFSEKGSILEFCYQNNESLAEGDIKKLYQSFSDNINNALIPHTKLFNYFSNDIAAYRNENFIPKENSWWYQFNPVTSKAIQKQMEAEIEFSAALDKQLTIKDVKGRVKEIIQPSIRYFTNISDDFKNLISALKSSLIHGEELSTRKVLVWGENDVPDIIKTCVAQRQIIEDLIGVIEADDSMTEKKRKELIITAYFLIDDQTKLTKILEDD